MAAYWIAAGSTKRTMNPNTDLLERIIRRSELNLQKRGEYSTRIMPEACMVPCRNRLQKARHEVTTGTFKQILAANFSMRIRVIPQKNAYTHFFASKI